MTCFPIAVKNCSESRKVTLNIPGCMDGSMTVCTYDCEVFERRGDRRCCVRQWQSVVNLEDMLSQFSGISRTVFAQAAYLANTFSM